MIDPIQNFENNFEEIANTYTIDLEQSEEEVPIKHKIIQIVNKYATIENVPFDLALIGICSLLQSGAYLKSVTNRKIKISNKEFTKKTLVFAAEQVDNKYTLRKIARVLKHIIAKVSYKYNIPGHLYSRFKIENANFIAQNTPETNRILATFCTDFQIDNIETPAIIREYLANREKNRSMSNKKN